MVCPFLMNRLVLESTVDLARLVDIWMAPLERGAGTPEIWWALEQCHPRMFALNVWEFRMLGANGI